MGNYGRRVRSNPLLVKNGKEPQFLKRVPTNKKLFQEEWLQKLIFDHPELLPAGEVEPVFRPLISIGREIPTDAGPIDNLFISPQGYLTIVETKLWRNPEARREVVGQIVDYAKEVSKWSFDDLDKKVKKYFQGGEKENLGVIDHIRQYEDFEEEEENELIDAITKNMKLGHFLLLIVGDGIRESVEDMAEYLAKTPQLHFTLGLVELKIYEVDEGRLVLPQLVMKTKEVTRAVIRIEGGNVENLSVDMDLSTDKESSGKRRYTLSEEEYFNALRKNVREEAIDFVRQLIEDVQEMDCEIQWRQSSFVIKYPDPAGSRRQLTLLVVSKKGVVYSGWLIDQMKKLDLPVEIGRIFTERLKDILKNCEVEPSKPNYWALDKVMEKHDEVIQVIEEFIEGVNGAGE